MKYLRKYKIFESSPKVELDDYDDYDPTIYLNIHTSNYGDMKIGFGLKDKKYKLMNWGSIRRPGHEDVYDDRVMNEISRYIREEVQKLTFDESINFLNLKVNNKIDWTWE
jgi:hypothetical protein